MFGKTKFLVIAFLLGGHLFASVPIFHVDKHQPEKTQAEIKKRVLSMYHIVDVRYVEEVEFYITLYTGRYAETFSTILGRSQMFFPIIDQYTRKHNLPSDLRYLPVIESALKPWATSRSKAVGLWQIMHPLGQYYQLRIDDYVDERRDIYKASETAMIYLTELYDQFDDWTLALAAYNCGPGRMRRAIKASGSRDFWELRSFLPKETQRYIPKFIAFSYMMQYYMDHNLEASRPMENYNSDIEYTVVFDKLSFEEISELSGVPKEDVKDLNASYLKSYIPSNSEGYLLNLPDQAMGVFLQNYHQSELDSIYQGQWPRFAIIPNYKVQQSAYTVRPGDNLYNLARKYDCRVSDLMNWNRLKSDRLHPGQRLTLVCRALDIVPESREVKLVSDIPVQEANVQLKKDNSTKIVKPQYASFVPKPAYRYHVVKGRETLKSIAEQYGKLTVEEINTLNSLERNQILHTGMRLIIGSKSASKISYINAEANRQ